MRITSAILGVALGLVFAACGAEPPEYRPQTGDAGFDAWLVGFNDKLKAHPADASGELTSASGATPQVVDGLLTRGYELADVYLIARTAKVAGLSSKRVVSEFEQSRNQGWGSIFANLEIRADSAEFTRLKLRADQPGGAGDKIMREMSAVDAETRAHALDARALPDARGKATTKDDSYKH
jgi:hypothetical protein